MRIIDSHIHLDHYKEDEIRRVLDESFPLERVISVSYNLQSCKRNLELMRIYPKVEAAFGYHPEQQLPTEEQQDELFSWMERHLDEMIAIGEVGLPYYLRREQKVSKDLYEQYIELLVNFIQMTGKWEKPVVLHAVRDDAQIACDILEKYSIKKAHFHWFKGDSKTISRMKENGYFISITPDVVYEEETQQLAEQYPLDQMMIETDGPWPFDGPFSGEMTHPNMMIESIQMIAKIKKMSPEEVSDKMLQNTRTFYQLKQL